VDDFSGRIGFFYHLAIKPLLAAEQARGTTRPVATTASTLIAAVHTAPI